MYKKIINEAIKKYVNDRKIFYEKFSNIIVMQKRTKFYLINSVQIYVFIFLEMSNIDTITEELKILHEKIRKNVYVILLSNGNEMLEKNIINICKDNKRLRIIMGINYENGSITFGKYKTIESKVFTERNIFLLNEYKTSDKEIWQSEMNILYDIGIKNRDKIM